MARKLRFARRPIDTFSGQNSRPSTKEILMGSQDRTNLAGAGSPADNQLTRAALMRMELFAPAAPLTPFVTTFFRMQCDEASIRDVQPSSIGIIALMGRGSGRMNFLDGRSEASHPFTVLTPSSAAGTFEVDGPWDVFGAMLSPIGWAGLTGLSAAEHGNRLYDGASFMPEPLSSTGCALLEEFEGLASEEMAERLGAAIIASVRPLPKGHAEFIAVVAAWLAQSLSPDLGNLYSAAGYGERQVQRLTERYFGLPPRSLARKYRALRAAVLLSRPALSPDEIAAIQDHFYDQPHMIREIRLFAGRTPARIADPDTPYLSAFLDLRDFRESGPRMAPIPDNLRD
jgi:AraC-like DNA-binding protein